MESKLSNFSQLFLRVAISASYLSAVADRFGLWGLLDNASVSWGNWQNFVAYSNSLNAFLSPQLGEIAAIIATALEIIIPVMLLIGYQTKLAALCSAALLTAFGLTMTISLGIKPPLDYSVFTGIGASLLLAAVAKYKFSVDYLLNKSAK